MTTVVGETGDGEAAENVSGEPGGRTREPFARPGRKNTPSITALGRRFGAFGRFSEGMLCSKEM